MYIDRNPRMGRQFGPYPMDMGVCVSYITHNLVMAMVDMLTCNI